METTGSDWVLIFLLFFFSVCSSENNDAFLSEIGVCTSIDNAGMLKDCGYSYVEETVGHFLMPLKSDEEFAIMLQKAETSPLKVKACNSFIPGNMKSVGPDAVHQKILKYMETAFRRAQKAGIEYIVFGSGVSRNIPDDFPREDARIQFIGLCKSMAEIASKYNVVVVLEPLNVTECNFINSVAEGGEIVREVDHPNFRLLADIYHMLMENESPENILKYGVFIKHIHIAEKKDRAAPGTNHEDFTSYFEALKKISYKGSISVECRWEDMETQARMAINSIIDQIEML